MEERNVCLDIQWKRGVNDWILHGREELMTGYSMEERNGWLEIPWKREMNDWTLHGREEWMTGYSMEERNEWLYTPWQRGMNGWIFNGREEWMTGYSMEERNECLDIQWKSGMNDWLETPWKRGMNDRILHTKRGMNDWILSALHDSNVILDTVQSVHRKCGCCNLYCIVYTVCVSSSKCLLKGSQQFLNFSKEWAPNFMRQPWQNIFQNCHLQLSACAAFLNSRKGGRGHRAPLLLSPLFHSPLPSSSPFFPS